MADVVAIRGTDMEPRFAECRAMGHEWRKQKPLGSDQAHDRIKRPFGMLTGSIGIPSHCNVCGGDKVRWVSRSGESTNRYDMPDGYARHGDDVRTKREWTHTYVQAIFTEFEQAISSAPRKRAARKRA